MYHFFFSLLIYVNIIMINLILIIFYNFFVRTWGIFTIIKFEKKPVQFFFCFFFFFLTKIKKILYKITTIDVMHKKSMRLISLYSLFKKMFTLLKFMHTSFNTIFLSFSLCLFIHFFFFFNKNSFNSFHIYMYRYL